MNLACFSLRVDFAPSLSLGAAKGLRIFGGKTTRASASASALKQFCRPHFVAPAFGGAPRGFPKMLSVLWLKSTFARNHARFIFRGFLVF